MRIKIGDQIKPFAWSAIDGTAVFIPDQEGQIVNLQFSRWAGCPICNMHLAGYHRRRNDLERARIKVVIVFHSPPVDVIDLRSDLPFALIADPDKTYYRIFGVQRSPFFLFHRKAFEALRREAKAGRRAQRIHGGVFGLPADFLIDPTGCVLAAHYGAHADDSLGVDQVIEVAKENR